MESYIFICRALMTCFFALQLACGSNLSQKLSLPHAEAPPRVRQPAQNQGQRAQQGRISKEEAIAIASEDASKSYPSIPSLNVVACGRARLWVIIFDRGGPEYYIDRMSGAILYAQTLPINVKAESSEAHSHGINEAQAVEIARRHFISVLLSDGDEKEHVNEYDAVPCEMSNAWRVFFEYRAPPNQNYATLPNTNPPNYVIDKTTGKIIFATHRVVSGGD